MSHAVHVPDLSFRVLGDSFGTTFEACRRVARTVAGEEWAASAVHEPVLGTSYVFRFACPMASLRFSAQAAMVISQCGARAAYGSFD